jgi:mannose-1-phosphate guanylyltransferase
MTKTPSVIHPVILCGGADTRVWPLSRKSFPKQFVPLIGNKSLLQLTLEPMALKTAAAKVVANAAASTFAAKPEDLLLSGCAHWHADISTPTKFTQKFLCRSKY